MTTNKRFLRGFQSICDTKEDKEYNFHIDNAISLLNELNDENERLKQKIISLEDARYSYKQDWKQASTDCEVYKDEIYFLKDENNGLIEENKQLKKELFEARKDYILETYADNPIRRDERLKALEKELK